MIFIVCRHVIHVSTLFISHFLTVPQKSKVKDLSGILPYIVMVRQKSPGFSALYFTVRTALFSWVNHI